MIQVPYSNLLCLKNQPAGYALGCRPTGEQSPGCTGRKWLLSGWPLIQPLLSQDRG